EVIAVRPLENPYGLLVPPEYRFELSQVGITVRAVGQNDRAARETREHAVERLGGGAPVAEGRIAFRDFPHLGRRVDRQALPIAGKSFKKMISFDVAIV